MKRSKEVKEYSGSAKKTYECLVIYIVLQGVEEYTGVRDDNGVVIRRCRCQKVLELYSMFADRTEARMTHGVK